MQKPTRDFIFIDERGDPGPIGTGSKHYATCAIHATDIGLERLIECFADMRFYRQVYSEMKGLHAEPALRPKLVEILTHMAGKHGVVFSITHLDKSRYTGPYLAPGKGTEFRNFQVRRLLEWHFHGATIKSQHCELIFDRHAHSASQLKNFTEYLNNNWNLPSFAVVAAVDSRYVESIQIADLVLRLFAKKVLGSDPRYQDVNLDFVRIRDVTLMYKGWKP